MWRLALILIIVTLAGCNYAFIDLLKQGGDPVDEPVTGDSAHGAEIFTAGAHGAPPCITCHGGADSPFRLAPDLAGIFERAANRIEGLSAEEYVLQSILDPEAYLVPGYRAIMYPLYGEDLTEQDIVDLVAYLQTL